MTTNQNNNSKQVVDFIENYLLNTTLDNILDNSGLIYFLIKDDRIDLIKKIYYDNDAMFVYENNTLSYFDGKFHTIFIYEDLFYDDPKEDFDEFSTFDKNHILSIILSEIIYTNIHFEIENLFHTKIDDSDSDSDSDEENEEKNKVIYTDNELINFVNLSYKKLIKQRTKLFDSYFPLMMKCKQKRIIDNMIELMI